MSTCERCKLPLIDGRAGFSADGRRICTRVECQNVERMNRMIDEGRMELVPAEQFAVKVESPVKASHIVVEPYIHAVLTRPLCAMDIPRDKSHPPDAVQCHGCGGHGCTACSDKGWLPAGHPGGRTCHKDNCGKPIPPAQIEVYCSSTCAYEDADD